MTTNDRLEKQVEYSIALQRAIEYHCRGDFVPAAIAELCNHHAEKLNRDLLTRASQADKECLSELHDLLDLVQTDGSMHDLNIQEPQTTLGQTLLELMREHERLRKELADSNWRFDKACEVAMDAIRLAE